MSKLQQPRFDIVAIGGSAGALDAVRPLLATLPRQFNATVVLCFHRPIERESALVEILGRASHLPVLLAKHGDILRPGICYIGHPRMHLTVGPGLVVQSVHNGFYRAHNIDLLFSSLARNAGGRTIGVLLSGLSKDGVEGLRAIKEAGGKALVQCPFEAMFDTLPRNALTYDGLIDTVAPVRGLAAEIGRLTGSGATVHDRLASGGKDDSDGVVQQDFARMCWNNRARVGSPSKCHLTCINAPERIAL